MARQWNRQRTISGALFFGFGIFAIAQASRYQIGSVGRPGTGLFPLILGAALAILGLVAIIVGMFEAEDKSFSKGWGRAILFIPLAVLSFGLIVDQWGLVPAIIVSTFFCGLASPKFRPLETAILCVITALFGTALFIYGLDLPFRAFGQ